MKKVLPPAALPLALAALPVPGCQSPAPPAAPPNPPARIVPAGATEASLRANWKERLDQPYVYLEHRGDYRALGGRMRELFAAAETAGIAATGPPFALFFDDPGAVAIADLTSRVCLPVDGPPAEAGGLAYDVLPPAMVAYGLVPGAYDRVAGAYPALFAYVEDHGWTARGPLREIYLVNPADAASFADLLTEVQIPWVPGR
ncbi:MAG: GyrI-like domain-containing protein [Planctomycetota bacterium]